MPTARSQISQEEVDDIVLYKSMGPEHIGRFPTAGSKKRGAIKSNSKSKSPAKKSKAPAAKKKSKGKKGKVNCRLCMRCFAVWDCGSVMRNTQFSHSPSKSVCIIWRHDLLKA